MPDDDEELTAQDILYGVGGISVACLGFYAIERFTNQGWLTPAGMGAALFVGIATLILSFGGGILLAVRETAHLNKKSEVVKMSGDQ